MISFALIDKAFDQAAGFDRASDQTYVPNPMI
jgi:hypothetical protein